MYSINPVIAGTKELSSLPALSLTTVHSHEATFATPLSAQSSSVALRKTDQHTPAVPPNASKQQLQQHQQPCHCDFESERKSHMRQNHEIARLIAIKAFQIRQFETEISHLERTNLGLAVSLRRAQEELQEHLLLGTALRKHVPCAPSVTTNTWLQEEWIQLIKTQEHIPQLQQQVESELSSRPQQPTKDFHSYELEYIDSSNLILSLTPRSKKRKLESLMFSSANPRDLALLKLGHIRAIYDRERSALLEIMRSHRSTTEIYKETLRILCEDRACIGSSSNVYKTSMSSQVLCDGSNGGLGQSPDSPHHCGEALLLPSDRSAQEALTPTLPNLNQTLTQRTPSPLPFFRVETAPDVKHSVDFNRARNSLRSQSTFTPKLNITPTSRPRGANRRISLGYSTTTLDGSAPQISSYDSARRPRRHTSKFAMNTLPALIEQGNDLPFDEREAHTAIPSQPAAHSPPVYVRPANYQDLVVGHQKRHTTPSTPKSPRKLSFNPYRRQSPSSVSKGSPSAEEKRVRYMQERIKVKIQTKNLIAKFKNNSTSDGTGGALSPKSKEGRPAIDSRFAVDGKVAMSVEEDIIDLTSPAPPAGASVSTASEEIVLRAPSRIPRATRAQHRSKTARTHHKGGAVTNAEKLKSLTASQLLRRMNKYLLGTSKLPVLSRTIVQKGLSASLHLAARKPTVGILSSLSPVPLTSISGTTSDIIPATTSTAASTPTATAVQAIAVESTFDTTEDQVTAGATPPTAAGEVVAMATSTKKSNRAAPVTKSGRVTRSIVSDKFRRVTRSTTVAVSQKL